MGLRIRPFESKDYEAVVEIGNRLFPEYPDTVDEVRYQDEHRDPKCKFQRFVAELGGRVVGHARYDQSSAMYHPQKFEIGVFVDPEHQGRGIGKALYEHLLEALAPFDPIKLFSFAREDYERSVRFLCDRGFTEAMRSWESRLDVQSFDFAPYEGAIERVEAQGIRIVSLKELMDDPECPRKLFELERDLLKDVPFPDRYTPEALDFETFHKRTFENPDFLPEAYLIALDGERYVGTSALWKSQAAPRELYTGLTGVRREHRRKGIALALKLKGIAFAQAHGYRTIKTWNESNNRVMLSINERLGFVKQPAWITFAKVLKPEGGSPGAEDAARAGA
jgi:GNAT superfamily N-acetyltransferase